ncbi:hypothetical protein DPMN_170330 [Dreissena polymorpha]|uniref:Uncharacterized protein n=1 Tax=Dreissena polymorpha TaxID=45954 RepID=A0A9D4IEH1_DREPO|nr:hypothetical protein DPMN_170330 [Dreissena polymorpha]
MCLHGKYGKDIGFLKKRNLSPSAAYAVSRPSCTTFRFRFYKMVDVFSVRD